MPKESGFPTMSVIICVRNMASHLPRQLNAVLNQETPFDFEIVLVDNGSSDSSRKVAASYADADARVRVIDADRRGLNIARNCGIQAARSAIVAMCDADDEVEPLWLASLHTALDSRTYVGGALRHGALNTLNQARRWNLVDEPLKVPKYVMLGVETPAGGNCCFLKSMWRQLGGFDESLSGCGDETEFFARAGLAGYRYAVAPLAVVRYRYPETARAAWRRGLRCGRQRQLLFEKVGEASALRLFVRGWLALMRDAFRVAAHRRGIYGWIHTAGLLTGEALVRLQNTFSTQSR